VPGAGFEILILVFERSKSNQFGRHNTCAQNMASLRKQRPYLRRISLRRTVRVIKARYVADAGKYELLTEICLGNLVE
jgi:hypothetical protein